MKTLMLFCSALIIGLNSISSPIQAREGGYGGFTQENLQEFNDYILVHDSNLSCGAALL